MGRSPTGGIIFTEEINSNKAIIKKGPWTPEEDRMLVDYIEIHGHGSWRALPKLAGLNRCGKSCRLRWTNYLRPDIRRGNFTEDEEKLIILLHSLLGNKWSAIATHLSGRTDNEIKNYWNTHLKKKLLQMGIDPVTHQPLPTTNDLHRLLASAANLNLPQLLSLLLSNNQLYTTPSSTAGGYGMLNSALIKSRSQYYPDANHFAGAQSVVNYNLLLQFLSSPDAAASTNTNISTTPVPIIEAIIGLLGPAPTVPLFDDNHQLLEYLTRLMKNPEQSNQLLGLSLCNDGTPSGLPDPYPSSFPSLEELLQQCSTAAAVTCNANTNYSAVISNSISNYQLPTSGMSNKPLTDHIGLLTTGGGGGSGKEKYDHVGSPTSCSSSIIPRFETIPALVSASSLKPTVNNIASTRVIHDDQTSGSSKMKPITTNDISRSNPAFSTISIMFDGWEDRLMNDEASDHDHESYWRDLIECNTACQTTGFNSKFTTRGSTS